MALDPESLLGTPAGYASPQQLAMARELAAALMRPQQQGHMQSWTQPASQIVNALLGAKMMKDAAAQERSMAGAGLGMGSPLSQPGQGPAAGPGPQTSISGSDPASIRYNNPGAQWPGPSASNYGSTGYGVIGGGNKIAQFPDAESGAAAQFDLLARKYSGMPLAAAVHKWSGGNSSQSYTAAISQATGLSPDTVLTPQILSNPGVAVPLAKAMAQFETGRPYPLSDEQWQAAHARVFGGAAQTAEGGPVRTDAAGAPPSPAGGPQQAPVSPTGGGPQPTPGASTSPQMTPGSQPPPQMFRQGLITPEIVYAARMRGDPMAGELYKMYLQQQQPQEVPYGDTHYGYIPAHPEIKPWTIPQPHQFKEFGGEGVPKYPGQIQQTPQGFVQSPVPMAGAPLGQPPAAAGGGGPAPSVGTGAQPPTDFASATQAAIDLKNREAEAQTRGQEDAKLAASQYKGRAGLADIAGQQKQNISALVSIVNDKNDPMISGPGANSARFFQRVATQFAPLFGKDPEAAAASPAASREVFEMLMKRVLADQFSGIRSLASETGEQGGRILKTFFDAEQGALPTAEDSLPGIRAKLNILDRAGDYLIKWGRMADQYKSQNKSLDPAFHSMMVDEMSKARLLPSGGGATSDFPVPPQGALEYLKANPNTRNAFEEKYGISAAERAVRGQ